MNNKMSPKRLSWNRFSRCGLFSYNRNLLSIVAGQAIVEFTLVFLLLLVIALVPTDFGLAFYTGQLALNASREGARIAAADPTLDPSNSGVLPSTNTSCSLPCGAPAGSPLYEAASRLSTALLPGATIRICYPVTSVDPAAVNPCTMGAGGSTCNQQVAVIVKGDYNYFLLGLLQFFVPSVPSSVSIARATQMRWEHQPTCS